MTALLSLYDRLFGSFERFAPALVPTLARLVFAGVLLLYFWGSAYTKVGDGIGGLFSLSTGAYAQIFPKAFEAAGYNAANLTLFHKLVALAGTWAEFLLPAAIVLGVFTRAAALGMIGFVLVQSLVDISGHGADAATRGAWFDRASDALILDQRAFWVFLLLVLFLRGAGPISVDRFFGRV